MDIIGIDPGITGAVACIHKNGEAAIWDTPFIEIKKGKKKKNDYLPAEMARIVEKLDDNLDDDPVHAFIEQVGAMPNQGVTSMFNFGKGYGMWIGILAALEIPYTFVTPQAWKKELMQGISDKNASRLRAQQLYPSISDQLKLKKHDGRAEALLIAEYGRRQLGIGKAISMPQMRRRR